MSVNKYRPHILVLPEDDADRQIANGFTLEPTLNQRNISILRPSGGWARVVEDFSDNIRDMNMLPSRILVLLIDFDEKVERLENIQKNIPNELCDRVFVLGVWSNPEKLRQSLGKNLEDIGKLLAQDCYNAKKGLWEHELLKHNEKELDRMIALVKPILFCEI